MTYRPQDEHDSLLNLQKQLNQFRNSNVTIRNNGTSVSTAAYGMGSQSSMIPNMNGSWAINPMNHNIGSFNTAGGFVNNTPDSSGRYHIRLQSTSIIVVGSTPPFTLSYIDGTQNNGQLVMIRCQQGTTLTLKAAGATDTTQGNIKLDSDITLDDHHIAILQFFNDIGTGGGKYIVLSSSGGGNFANTALSNLINPTIINQNLIFGDGTTFAQGKDIINIDTLDFHSTTAFHPYIVGNGSNNQFNIGAHSSDIITLTNVFNSGTGVPDNGILQVFGMSHGVHSGTLWVPSLKTVNLSSTVVNGNYVGGIYMDALDSTLTQRTFGAIFTIADSVSGSLAGRLSLQAIVPSGTSLQEYMSISNAGIGVNVDIVPSGFASIQAGNVSFPFKNVYSAGLKYLSNSILLAATDMTYNAVSSVNHKFVINSTTLFGIETDNTFGDIGYVDFYQGHRYTSATSGTGSALPATPYGYLIILVNGVRFKMPYYNV